MNKDGILQNDQRVDISPSGEKKGGLSPRCVVGVDIFGWKLWLFLVMGLLVSGVGASEFPERECCDPLYPPNTGTTAAAPVTDAVSKSPEVKGMFFILYFIHAFLYLIFFKENFF